MQTLPVQLGPEHLSFLYELVVKSMDPSPDVQKPSEALLGQYCTIPGYSSALLVHCYLAPLMSQKLASMKEVSPEHRLMSLILLKNFVQDKWKKSPASPQ